MDGHRGPGGEERTTLTDQLAGPDDPFWCTGARPWLAAPDDGCGQPIRAALRAAGNVYFPMVESSIYLPRKEGAVSAEMHDLLRSPQVGPRWSVLHDMLGDDVPAAQLRNGLLKLFAPYSDEELIAAFRDLFGPGGSQQGDARRPDRRTRSDDLTGSDEWRHPEYLVIRETPKDDFLSATDPGIHEELAGHLDRVRSVRRAPRDPGAARLYPGAGRRPEAQRRQGAPAARVAAAGARTGCRRTSSKAKESTWSSTPTG